MIRTIGIHRLAAFGILGISAIYFLSKTLFFQGETLDFKYLWLAGELWEQGLNPYGDVYVQAGREIFTNGNVPTWMVYPPSWYPIARLLSLFPYSVANLIWLNFSMIAIVLGFFVCTDTFRRTGPAATLLETSGMVAFLGLGSIMAIAVSVGQTSPLFFLGFALFWRGWSLQRHTAFIVGLIILMLKPNIGLPFAILALTRPFFWRPVLIGGAITILMAIPSFFPEKSISILTDYLAQLGQYGSAVWNGPANMTGLRNLVYLISGHDMSSFLLTPTAAILSGIYGLVTLNKVDITPDRQLMMVLALTTFLVPMHTYDFLVLAPMLLWLHREPWKIRVALGAAMLVLLRVNNVANVTGLTYLAETYAPGSTLASVCALIIFGAVLLSYRVRRP